MEKSVTTVSPKPSSVCVREWNLSAPAPPVSRPSLSSVLQKVVAAAAERVVVVDSMRSLPASPRSMSELPSSP